MTPLFPAPSAADRDGVVGAATPKQPQLGPQLTHALLVFVTHFWWLILLLVAIAAVRGVAWLVAERRLACSGIREIDEMDGITFERRMAVLFRNLGYRVARTQARGDYGADLVLEKDGVRAIVQAKRWTKNVGVKAIQEAVAAKPMYHCSRAIVVTNRYFTEQAKRLAKANDVGLWDRNDLVRALTRTAEV